MGYEAWLRHGARAQQARTMTYVFLDFDGPVVDLFHESAGRRLVSNMLLFARERGILLSPEYQYSHLFIPLWAELRKSYRNDPKELARFDQEIHLLIERHESLLLRSMFADDDGREVLSAARKYGAGVALVSNNSKLAIEQWLAQRQLRSLVDYVSAREPGNAFVSLKPMPELLLRALQHFHIPRNRAMFIGDSHSDLLSARAAGIAFAGLLQPDRCVRDSPPSGNWFLDSRRSVAEYIRKVSTGQV